MSDVYDLDELHKFAQSIGLKREWFQEKSQPHYDFTTRRKLNIAILAGAKLISRRELGKIIIDHNKKGETIV
jgi:hypothetical protein